MYDPRFSGRASGVPAVVTSTDLLKRDFTASRPDEKWCGDFKQIDTLEGVLFLSSCEDLFDRRLLEFAFSDTYPTAELA